MNNTSNNDEKLPLQFIIITGMSGAGKALAMNHFEDFGFFCVDNLPPQLLPMLAELCQRGDVGRVAVVTDVRGGTFFNELNQALEQLKKQGLRFRILYLDAETSSLIARFRETRRRHPLADEFPDLNDAIAREREALIELRTRADKVINTSRVAPRDLREEIRKIFLDQADSSQMLIRVQSFGFKHGLPLDADLVFDLRFLPNPNYDREIGHLDGNCAPVIDYVMREPVTQEFLRHLHDFLGFCVPQFEREGKSYLTIAVGCTGGRHRSVAIANWLANDLSKAGHNATATHRDLARSAHEPRTLAAPSPDEFQNGVPNADANDAASTCDTENSPSTEEA